MKKFLLIFLFVTSYGFAQNSGITYQAVIYNPNGEELPGVNNPYAALTEQSVCLQFGIIDASGTIEYQENVQVTTDAFGMVNLLIGTHLQTSGYAASFSAINWGADAKFLKVDIDIKGNCTNFEELSNQPFTYVPFAYYSPASDIPGPAGQDGTNGTDGIDGTDGVDGTDGTDGTNALNSLIRTTTEDPSSNCENGGTKIEIGIDTNNDGILNDPEIDNSQTRYICNGIDGTNGTDGTNGGDGTDGFKSLIKTTNESQGSNCENGGTKIETGIDTNNDGLLDASEIDPSQTRYICNGKDGADGTDGVDGLNNGGSGFGGGIDSNSGYRIEHNPPLVGGSVVKLSGDGNIISFDVSGDKIVYISSVMNNTFEAYSTITSPNDDNISISALNYDGSIAIINQVNSTIEKTYIYKYVSNGYELLETTSYFPNISSINADASLSFGYNTFTSEYGIFALVNSNWEFQVGLEYGSKINHSFTAYAEPVYGSFNGLSGNSKVTVYNYNNGVATPKGQPIFGQEDGEQISNYLAMDESANTVATVARVPVAGNWMIYSKVRVYGFDSNTNSWTQKGQEINRGNGTNGRLNGVFLSEDGLILTVANSSLDTNNNTLVRYKFIDNLWVQYGSVITLPEITNLADTLNSYYYEKATFVKRNTTYFNFIKKYD